MTSLREHKENILTEHFFRPRWYSIFLNPYFINRYTLYKAIQTFAATLTSHANVLDVGCGIKPYRKLFKTPHYTGIDIQGGGHADSAKTVDAFFDGITIPFPEHSFDAVICTQVLEHAQDPEALIAECARVLKPQGKIFISMPFTYPEHETPYDFRRFTRYEHTRLMQKNNFAHTATIQTTGFGGTFAQLFIVWIFENIPFRSTIFKGILTLLFFAPIQLLGLCIDRLTRKSGQTMDYIVTAQKI